jgi:hypothetical protein
MKTTVLRAAALAVALLTLPDSAAACGVCAFEQADYYVLPHAMAWSIAMAGWFFVLMMICTGEKRLSLSADTWHHFLLAVAFTFLAFVIGFMFLGTYPFLLLGLVAASATVKAFLPSVRQSLPKGLQVSLKVMSAVILVCMLAGGAISAHTKMTRSDAEFILQWNSGVILHTFISRPEKHEAALREVLARTKNKSVAERVSVALAEIDKKKSKPPADAQ